MRACVRLTREIFAQPAFDRYRGREMSAGRRGAERCADRRLHPPEGRERLPPLLHLPHGITGRSRSVVDPQGRVLGVEALRVVDSSIMPSITTGNLNAPTIMIAEKLSDAILGRKPLEASPAPIFQARDWESRQR